MSVFNRRLATALRAVRQRGVVVVAATVAAGASTATADLRIDMRATIINGAPLSGAQTAHSIPNAQAGDVIGFDIHALVTGTNANFMDDRVVIDAGSFKSSQQGLLPNLLGALDADVVRTQYDKNGDPVFLGFDNTGFSLGNRVDLDGDSDVDVGSNDPSQPSPHWVID